MVKKKVDLHIHTNASDGSWGIERLLEEIKDRKISIFSITDHDCIENVSKLLNKKINSNKVFVPGVEVSTTFNNKEYHITAYCFDLDYKDLNLLLKFNRKVREKFNRNIIRYFEDIYDKKFINEYIDYKNDKNRGGWKSLNFLKDKELVKDLEDFFLKISDMKKGMIFTRPEEAIDIIHRAGGYTFLAHPASYFNGELLDKEFLKEWLKYGIDGIEAYSPYLNKLKDADYYIDFCDNNNLMISSGSDCHGNFIEERKVGKPEIYLSDIRIDELIY